MASLAELYLLGALDNGFETPALGLAQRPSFHNTHEVANVGVVVFIMGLDLAGGTNDLAVQRVGRTLLELDGNRLVHLVGHDVAAANLTEVTLFSHNHFSLDSVAAGSWLMPSSRSRSTVYMRAMSLLTALRRAVFSS